MKRSRKSAILRGAARDLGGEGDGVVEDPSGRVWFVRGALPGDRVSFRPARSGRGNLISLDSPSEDRITSFCRYVRACGGCPTMEWSGAAVRGWKLGRVAAALGIETDSVSWVESPTEAYRCRIRLAFDGPRLGYRPSRSNRVVDVTDCPIAAAPVQAGLSALRTHLLETLNGQGEVTLAIGESRLPVLHLVTGAPLPPAAFRIVERLVQDGEFAGGELRTGGASVGATFGSPRPQVVSFDAKPIVVPPGGFSQANEEIACRLQELVRGWSSPGRSVLELYAGAGLLSVAIARAAGSLTTVESHSEAVACARENLAMRGLEATTIVGDAAAPPPRAYDTVLLDPPREGARDALGHVVRIRPETIIYVSCHVGSLKRDAAFLYDQGYTVDRAAALDMFPQTAHVETAARFTRTVR